jgi:hypothetical protein
VQYWHRCYTARHTLHIPFVVIHCTHISQTLCIIMPPACQHSVLACVACCLDNVHTLCACVIQVVPAVCTDHAPTVYQLIIECTICCTCSVLALMAGSRASVFEMFTNYWTNIARTWYYKGYPVCTIGQCRNTFIYGITFVNTQ